MIISVIGFSFGGKTTFIEKYFKNDVVLDIKKVYESVGYYPSGYLTSREWQEIDNELARMFDELLELATKKKRFLILEHSWSEMVTRLIASEAPYFTILVWTPISQVEERIRREKPDFDAVKLNRRFYKKLKEGMITYDVKYLTNHDLFIPSISLASIRRKIFRTRRRTTRMLDEEGFP